MNQAVNPRLAKWLGGGLRLAWLPTGIAFRVRVPDVEDLVTRELLPDDLVQIALRYQASGGAGDMRTVPVAELQQMLRFMRSLVAFMVQDVWEADDPPPLDEGEKPRAWIDRWNEMDGWSPVSLTLGMLEEGRLDGDDYAALQGIAQRTFTPEQITLLTAVEHGHMTADQTEGAINADAKATTPGWGTFRRKRNGAPGRADGGAVRPVASGKGRGKRSGSGAGARPGASR